MPLISFYDKVSVIASAMRYDVLLCAICFGLHIFLNHLRPCLKKHATGTTPAKRQGAASPSMAAKVSEKVTTPPAQKPLASGPTRTNKPPLSKWDNGSAKLDWKIVEEWASLKYGKQVPVAQLAQVVGAMRHLGHPGTVVVDEICGYLLRSKQACSISMINEFIDTLAKSMDTELVEGIVRLLPQLEIECDGITYAMLIQMNYTIRNFARVVELGVEMELKGLVRGPNTCLVLLKTAIHDKRLDHAILHFAEVFGGDAAVTASAAPTLVATQLVELIWSEGHVPKLYEALASGRLPRTPELQNALNRKLSRSPVAQRGGEAGQEEAKWQGAGAGLLEAIQ